MKLTAIYGSIFTLLAMSFMMFYIQNRAVTYASDESVSQNESNLIEIISEIDSNSMKKLTIVKKLNAKYVYIPVSEEVMEDDISIVNDYLVNTVTLYFEGMEENYYDINSISGNNDKIKSVLYTYKNGISIFQIKMTDIYECEIVKKNNSLCLEFQSPRELYDKIIVIDPGHGGTESGNIANGIVEKELNLDIAMKLQSLLSETDIKVYYTRLDDSNPDCEKRVQFANDINADMFISIHAVSKLEDDSMYGIQTVYNSNFFIPRFSSLELADMIEKSVVTLVNGRANGLIMTKEDNVIVSKATIPVALLEVGFLSNKKEAILLGQDEYRMKIAEGIYEGILEAYR